MQKSDNIFTNYKTARFQFLNLSPEAYLSNISIKKSGEFKVFTKNIKISFILFCTVTTFIGTAVSIYCLKNIVLFSGEYAFLIYLIFPLLFIVFLMSYLMLMYRGLLKIGRSFIVNRKGQLFIEKYRGICPYCHARLKFLQNLTNGEGIAQCMFTDMHHFSFSPKQFDEAI